MTTMTVMTLMTPIMTTIMAVMTTMSIMTIKTGVTNLVIKQGEATNTNNENSNHTQSQPQLCTGSWDAPCAGPLDLDTPKTANGAGYFVQPFISKYRTTIQSYIATNNNTTTNMLMSGTNITTAF